MWRTHNKGRSYKLLTNGRLYGAIHPELFSDTIAQPLRELTKAQVEFKWDEKEREAFQKLKES